MRIKITTKGIDAFLLAFQSAPEAALRNMALAMTVSLKRVREYARLNHRFIYRSGKLEKNILSQQASAASGRFRGRVYLNVGQAGAPYGVYVHEGTKPHDIRPIKAKYLRWVDAKRNAFCFAKIVHHPGTLPDQFIDNAGKACEGQVQETFTRYAMRALKEAGLGG